MAGKMDFGNINGLLKQMQAMQKKLSDVEQKLENLEFKGAAGGGEDGDEDSRCELMGNGKFRIHKLKIGRRFSKLLGESETALLCDLLVAAVHDYCKKVQSSSGEDIANMASAMGLPSGIMGGDNILGNLLGTTNDEEDF